jgi:hypothetical protein
MQQQHRAKWKWKSEMIPDCTNYSHLTMCIKNDQWVCLFPPVGKYVYEPEINNHLHFVDEIRWRWLCFITNIVRWKMMASLGDWTLAQSLISKTSLWCDGHLCFRNSTLFFHDNAVYCWSFYDVAAYILVPIVYSTSWSRNSFFRQLSLKALSWIFSSLAPPTITFFPGGLKMRLLQLLLPCGV